MKHIHFYRILYGLMLAIFSLTTVNAQHNFSPYLPIEITPVRVKIEKIKPQSDIVNLKFYIKSGWKTYANIKQEIGITPELLVQTSSNLKSWEWQWPIPKTLYEGDAQFQGYDDDFNVTISFVAIDPKLPISISGELNIGACETLCLPMRFPIVYSTQPH